MNGGLLMVALDPEIKRKLKLHPHMRLTMATLGLGTYEGWNLLALRCNTGHYASTKYMAPGGPQYAIMLGLHALSAVHERYMKQDRIILKGDEIRDIGEALNQCDEVQDLCSRLEWTEVTTAVFALSGIKWQGFFL